MRVKDARGGQNKSAPLTRGGVLEPSGMIIREIRVQYQCSMAQWTRLGKGNPTPSNIYIYIYCFFTLLQTSVLLHIALLCRIPSPSCSCIVLCCTILKLQCLLYCVQREKCRWENCSIAPLMIILSFVVLHSMHAFQEICIALSKYYATQQVLLTLAYLYHSSLLQISLHFDALSIPRT